MFDDEPPDEPEDLVGALGPRVEQEEDVLLPVDLGVLHVLAPLLHPRRVPRVPVSEDVAPRGDHEHRGHRHGVQRRPHLQVNRRVVPARAFRQGQPEVPLGELGGEERVRRALRLRARPRLAGHGRHQEDAAADAGRDRRVVRDVPAGGVAGDEDAGEVGGAGEPGVVAGAVAQQPRQGRRAVLLRRGEAVLGRETVVEGGHDGGELRGEAEAPVVEDAPAAGADAEAAAVEVGHHGDPRAAGESRPVQPRAEAVGRVVDHVLPHHAAVVSVADVNRERRLRVAAPHRAVAHHLQHAAAVLHHVRLRRRRRHGWRLPSTRRRVS